MKLLETRPLSFVGQSVPSPGPGNLPRAQHLSRFVGRGITQFISCRVASSAAYDSFLGYALNQRTKFLETKDGRPAKYPATYLRVLYNLCELLDAGTCTICIAETPMGPPSFERKRSRFAPER